MFSINSHVYQGLTGWRKRKENGWNVVNIKVEFVSQLIYLCIIIYHNTFIFNINHRTDRENPQEISDSHAIL